jgi:hypothetical protein
MADKSPAPEPGMAGGTGGNIDEETPQPRGGVAPPSGRQLSKFLEKNAKKIISQKYGVHLDDSNTMYSSINTHVEQWGFNRDNNCFDNDTHMILLDQHDKKLHYFFLKRGTIENPETLFRQRNDERRQNCSIIIIPVSADNFKEQYSGFPFGNYKKVTIPY